MEGTSENAATVASPTATITVNDQNFDSYFHTGGKFIENSSSTNSTRCVARGNSSGDLPTSGTYKVTMPATVKNSNDTIGAILHYAITCSGQGHAATAWAEAVSLDYNCNPQARIREVSCGVPFKTVDPV